MHRSIILSAGTDTASSTCDCGHPAHMHAPLGCWSTRGDCDALCTCAGYRMSAAVYALLSLSRFLSRVTGTHGGCWDWQGARTEQGYGQFWHAGRMVGAHRFAYESGVGPIPEGLTLDHLCRNTSCVNPDHLEPVTLAENIRRSFAARGFDVACANGHTWTVETLYVDARHWRQCRTCRRNRRNLSGAAPRPLATDTHCANGHLWTDESTYVRPDGQRACRTCRRDYDRERKRANL